jgi:hypothetical protein
MILLLFFRIVPGIVAAFVRLFFIREPFSRPAVPGAVPLL